MKQLLLPVLALGLLASCSTNTSEEVVTALSRDEVVRNNAEEYIIPKLGDPDSYEFASLELIDSVLYKDNIEYRKDHFARALEYAQGQVDRQLEFKKDFPTVYKEEVLLGYQEDVKKNEAMLSKIDSLTSALGEKSNEVASYTYIYKFRNTNGFGAKVLNERIIQTTPDLGILNMADDTKDLYLNPNDFPGYQEVVVKHL